MPNRENTLTTLTKGDAMKTAYYEIAIRPHSAGFGVYELGEQNYSPNDAWADLADLEAKMATAPDEILPLVEALHNEDFIDAGVIDIRGRIYGGDPPYLYACLSPDGMGIRYTGIETEEVADDFWN